MNRSNPIPEILERLDWLERQVARLTQAMEGMPGNPLASKPPVQPPAPAAPQATAPPPLPVPREASAEISIPTPNLASDSEKPSAMPPAAQTPVAPKPIGHGRPQAPQSRPQPALYPTPHETPQRPASDDLRADPQASREIRWGAWLAIRAGAVLLVMGIVFLGIKMALNQPPWMRFVEILLAAGGLSAAGWRLERRYPVYGAVVFSAGLAVGYFAMLGAYAVPAMRVFSTPFPSLLLQAGVVVLAIGCALRRREPALATMATLLGLVACFFSMETRLLAATLPAAWLLGVAAVIFLQRRGWVWPAQIAMPFSYAIFAWLVLRHGRFLDPQPGLLLWLIFPLANLLLYLGPEIWRLRHSAAEQPARRWLQGVSSCLAIATGTLVTRHLHAPLLGEFYLGFGVIWLGLAAGTYALARREPLATMFGIKAMALIAMFLIMETGGETRWLALGAQAFVILAAARLTGMRTVYATSTAVWILSLLFCLNTAIEGKMMREPASWDSQHGLLAITYLLGSALLVSLHGAWSRRRTERGETPEETEVWDALHLVLLALLAGLTVATLRFGAHGPLAIMALSLAMAAIGRATGNWTAPAAALVPLAMAHGQAWMWDTAAQGRGSLMLNAGGLIVTGIALAQGLLRRLPLAEEKDGETSTEVHPAAVWLHLLWLPLLLRVEYLLLAPAGWETVAWAVTALAMAVLAPRLRPQWLPEASLVPIGVLTAMLVSELLWAGAPPLHPAAVWISLGLVFGHACLASPPRAARGDHNRRADAMNTLAGGLICAVATLAALLLIALRGYTPREALVAMAAVALLVAAIGERTRLRGAIWSGATFAVAATLTAMAGFLFTPVLDAGRVPWPELTAAALLLAFAAAGPAWSPSLAPAACKLIQAGGGVATLLVAFGALSRALELHPGLISASWAGAAALVFAAGFAARSRSLRIVALLAFGVCILRAIAIDIDSLTGRIYAFITLGAILMMIGFVYVRFKESLERWDRAGEKARGDEEGRDDGPM